MKPEDIRYLTELDNDFALALRQIMGISSFKMFLDEWGYWLDDETKKLKPEDWEWLAPLVADCRNERIVPEEKHRPAMALTMPRKLMEVSIRAHQFGVPWGCAYIQMKKAGIISF